MIFYKTYLSNAISNFNMKLFYLSTRVYLCKFNVKTRIVIILMITIILMIDIIKK